jgi:uncharacterized protein
VVESVSAAQARRIALGAQGFGARPAAVGTRQLNLALHRLAVLQLDSVNVFERSHYLPLLARLGPYDKALLDRLVFTRRSPYIEYWAHQASLVPIEEWPLWGFRRRRYRDVRPKYPSQPPLDPAMAAFLLAELADRGPSTAGRLEQEGGTRKGPWWGWSDVKTALETMVDQGVVVVSHRRNFERFYDLPERRIPQHLLEQRVDEADALRALVRTSIRALGIGTVRDIADYYRLLQEQVKPALAELVDAGEVLPVRVHGWERPAAFLHAGARIPRRIEGTALLSPFDPIVWERERTLRMFGFHYRIEIYTPAPQRVFGYYTLPLLIDEALVGRIDLKSDRQAGVLRVQSAWREGHAAVDLGRVVAHLREIAAWQGLTEGIAVAEWGDLAAPLRDALR